MMAQETKRGVTQHRHHRWPFTQMNKAAVFTKSDIFDVMQAVLNLPVSSLEFQQSGCICYGWWQAGYAILDLSLGCASLLPGSFQAEHLGLSRPVAVADEVS